MPSLFIWIYSKQCISIPAEGATKKKNLNKQGASISSYVIRKLILRTVCMHVCTYTYTITHTFIYIIFSSLVLEAKVPCKRAKHEIEPKEDYEEWKRRILENAAKSQRNCVWVDLFLLWVQTLGQSFGLCQSGELVCWERKKTLWKLEFLE